MLDLCLKTSFEWEHGWIWEIPPWNCTKEDGGSAKMTRSAWSTDLYLCQGTMITHPSLEAGNAVHWWRHQPVINVKQVSLWHVMKFGIEFLAMKFRGKFTEISSFVTNHYLRLTILLILTTFIFSSSFVSFCMCQRGLNALFEKMNLGNSHVM